MLRSAQLARPVASGSRAAEIPMTPTLGPEEDPSMRARLLVVHGRPEGKSLAFPSGEYVFGRGTECHIRPNSDWVSRQHCMLRVTDDGLFVRDLGSRNGTLVNGVRVVAERRLVRGDQLQVGPLVFEVQPEETTAAPAPAAKEETGVFCNDTKEVPAVGAPAEPPVVEQPVPAAR
jgi:pSer/pThr/pTyr-binding forkhead associated (FHA) protein